MASGYVQEQIEQAAQTHFSHEKAEKALIGCLVVTYDRCAEIANELVEDDFFFAMHRLIFKAIKHAQAEHVAVDLVTIDKILATIAPEQAAYASSVMIDCATQTETWNAESYSAIVRELAVRRRAIELMNNIQNELRNPSGDINEIVDHMRLASTDLMVGKHSWVSMSDVLLDTYDYVSKKSTGDVKIITTGISNLDRLIGGFYAGELTIIGARPAVGKSIFGMHVALAAARAGFKVGLCSREMSAIQYGQRVLSSVSFVDGMKLRRGDMVEEDWDRILNGMAGAASIPISFLFTVRDVEDLRAEAIRKKARDGLDMLVVDYTQILDTKRKVERDNLRVGIISRALKEIALDLDIPVIALAQVKRGTSNRMPILEDLKDSGNLEQDADGVIFLHAPADENDDSIDPRHKEFFGFYEAKGLTYLSMGVAKQRQGETGIACVLLDKKHMRFGPVEKGEIEEDSE